MAFPNCGRADRQCPVSALIQRVSALRMQWATCWFNVQLDKAGGMRQAALGFSVLAIAGLVEAVMRAVGSPGLALTYLAFSASCAVIVIDLSSPSVHQGFTWLSLRGLVASVIALGFLWLDGAGGPSGSLVAAAAAPWPIIGLVHFLLATAVMAAGSSTGGLRWYGGRIGFALFGALASGEIVVHVIRGLRLQEASVGHSAVALLAAFGLMSAAWRESSQLSRAFALYRRRQRDSSLLG